MTQSTNSLRVPAPKPEDWDHLAATQDLYMDDATGVSTGAIGTVWGLAEGSYCIFTHERLVADDLHSLLALLAVDPELVKRPLPQMDFCKLVCDEGDVSRR